MWPEVLLALMLYVLITALFAAVLWPFRGASPIFWYPIALALIAIGIFIQIDFSHHSDGVHIVSSFIAVISFFVPAYSYSRIANLTAKLKIFKEKPVIDDTPPRFV
jgi:hypothetical protein